MAWQCVWPFNHLRIALNCALNCNCDTPALHRTYQPTHYWSEELGSPGSCHTMNGLQQCSSGRVAARRHYQCSAALTLGSRRGRAWLLRDQRSSSVCPAAGRRVAYVLSDAAEHTKVGGLVLAEMARRAAFQRANAARRTALAVRAGLAGHQAHTIYAPKDFLCLSLATTPTSCPRRMDTPRACHGCRRSDAALSALSVTAVRRSPAPSISFTQTDRRRTRSCSSCTLRPTSAAWRSSAAQHR